MWHRPAWWEDDDWRAGALAPVGHIWHAITRHRLRARAHLPPLPIPVICVGNIVAGGSGKTPLVKILSALLAPLGPVHVVTRGYGGTLSGPHLVDPAHDTAHDTGDEALEIAQTVPCWVARTRRDGVLAAHKAGARLVIMDDGLQNPGIRPDVHILAIDAHDGFGNGRGIPAGPLREHPDDVWPRIDAVILTGTHAESAQHQAQQNMKIPAHIPVFTAIPVLEKPIADHAYVAFAGIGRPEKFFNFLKENNITICYKKEFPDHHPFTEQDIAALRQHATAKGARLITTRKDILRLTKQLRQDIDVADITLRLSDADTLRTLVMTKMRGNPKA